MALKDRLMIHVDGDRLTFEMAHPDGSAVTVDGNLVTEGDPEAEAARVVEEFNVKGVDASKELESITQSIRDYRRLRLP